MHWLLQGDVWAALVTLIALEIVLGIDNIIFIAIITEKLPVQQQPSARILGLALAMISRIALLLSLSTLMGMRHPLFTLFSQEISCRDLVLIMGGLFLLYKATREIHETTEGTSSPLLAKRAVSYPWTLVQIMVLDIVFSLDSVITAVGMSNQLWIMVTAIAIAVGIMMWCSGAISSFIDKHPTVKMLALSFLIMIGLVLIADGFGHHVPKGYIYFAMAFSVFVEMLNLRVRAKEKHSQAALSERRDLQNTAR